MATASVVQYIHDVLQVCGIYELIACTCLINNKGFNSLKDFGVMKGFTDVLEIATRMASRSMVTSVKLGMVQIKGRQDLA